MPYPMENLMLIIRPLPTNRRCLDWIRMMLCALLFCAPLGWCYEGDIHQRMTFAAARQFNTCAPELGLELLTPLQVRYMAKTGVKEADSRGVRMFRWGFYERERQASKRLLGVVQTRLHERFDRFVKEASETEDLLAYYSVTGEIMTRVQDMSVPVFVVPIYYSRFWRFSLRDRLSTYPIDVEMLSRMLSVRGCAMLRDDEALPGELLVELADKTIAAIRSPISGFPATWESFWQFGSAGKFGRYGPAGNRFGEKTQFSCDVQECVLVEDDPLYREFATARHLDALDASLRLMRWAQQNR